MADVNISIPFEAYDGDRPFLFVSYAHKDAEIVFTELKWLHSAGYRIWYDEGIDPGNEWLVEIARALDRASCYLVFISKNSIKSKNVDNEISYALEECKRDATKLFLAIHIEEVTLESKHKLGMSTIQAIFQWQMSEERFVRKLTKSLPDVLRDKDAEHEREIVDRTTVKKKSVRISPFAALYSVLFVVILLLIVSYASGLIGNFTSQPVTENQTPPKIRDIIPDLD